MNQTIVDVIATLDKHIQERHLLRHPFYQAWSEGALSRHALQEDSKQYYRHVEAFPTYVSVVHANCPPCRFGNTYWKTWMVKKV
jgi:pyrroloquinoline-quinone synthase